MLSFVPAVAALSCLLAATGAEAMVRYEISQPIRQLLEPTRDDRGLCRLYGMSMNPIVLFSANRTTGTSAYWHAPTDRFVQYPGTSACIVWKRRGR